MGVILLLPCAISLDDFYQLLACPGQLIAVSILTGSMSFIAITYLLLSITLVLMVYAVYTINNNSNITMEQTAVQNCIYRTTYTTQYNNYSLVSMT